jgi:hypothetical protein
VATEDPVDPPDSCTDGAVLGADPKMNSYADLPPLSCESAWARVPSVTLVGRHMKLRLLCLKSPSFFSKISIENPAALLHPPYHH